MSEICKSCQSAKVKKGWPDWYETKSPESWEQQVPWPKAWTCTSKIKTVRGHFPEHGHICPGVGV